MRQLTLVPLAVLAALVAPPGWAQSPAPAINPAPAFEVASIKENKGADTGRFIRRQPGGRFNVTNMNLRDLIRFAYQVQPYQIEGVPDWAGSASYDIVARAESDPPPMAPGSGPDQMTLMLRTLLTDRFKLSVRRETRDSPVWHLVMARPDGKPAAGLRPTVFDCVALAEAARRGEAAAAPPPNSDAPMPCNIGIGAGAMRFGGFPMSQLANVLGSVVGRTVFDKTGLSGNYDFVMKFAPDSMPGLPSPPPGAAPAPVDTSAPSLFTALQEQLGLKLENARGPVEFLVVERVERPIED